MNFGLSQEISKDILGKAWIIHTISKALGRHFRDKDYGGGIKTITIGVICVSPNFEFFFKTRKKYSKNKNLIEYDVKLDYKSFKDASENQIYEILSENIVQSLNVIENLKVPDFDILKFRIDLEEFFRSFDIHRKIKTAS